MARESTCIDLTIHRNSNLSQFLESKDKFNSERKIKKSVSKL